MSCSRNQNNLSLQATAQQTETTSWVAGTRSFPKHHQRFLASNNNNSMTLNTEPTRCVDCPRSVALKGTLW